MSREILQNIFRFIALLAAQVVIINNLDFYGYVNIQLYLLFILLLPFEIQGWLLLLLGFITGFCVDIFTGIIGLHTSATVFIAFIRNQVTKIVGGKPDYETTLEPNIRDMGIKWFVTYASILIFVHQLVLSLLEVFSFYQFGQTLLRCILNSILTLFLFVFCQYVFRKRSA